MALLETCGHEHVGGVLSAAACDDLLKRVAAIDSAGSRLLLENDWCVELAKELRKRLSPNLPQLCDLVAVGCNYFHKSPDSNWFVAFHQDRSVPVVDSPLARKSPGWSQKEGVSFVHGDEDLLAQTIAVRLHLDDSTPTNGPLRVIPRSHESGVLSPENIAATVSGGCEEVITANKGDVVAMRPLLLHASSKTTDESPRRVLHFTYCPVNPPTGLRWRFAN